MPVPYKTLLAIRWTFRQTGRKLLTAPKPASTHGLAEGATPYQKEMARRLAQGEEDCEMNPTEYRHFAMVMPMTYYQRPLGAVDDFNTQCRQCSKHFFSKKARREHVKEGVCIPKLEAYYAKRKPLGRCVACAGITKDKFLGFPLCKSCHFQFKTMTRLCPNYTHYKQ